MRADAQAETHGIAALADPAIQEFVSRWGLDAQSASMLEDLNEEVCVRVMSEFDPRGNTRNPSGKFMAFLRTVVSTPGREMGTRADAQAETHGSAALADPAIQEFVSRWGLDTP